MAISFQKKHISLQTAQDMVAAAMKKAQEIGVPMSIAVCDADGTLKAFARMDGAALLSVRVAQQKAWTAISFGMATHQWFEFIKGDPPLLHGIVHQQDLIVFGGGYPIKEGNDIIGGIGVSGGHYSQDQQVAEAGLAVSVPA